MPTPLRALLRRQRRLYALGVVFVVVGIATALAYPQVIRLMIDDGILRGRLDRVNRLGLLMAALLTIEAGGTLLRNYLFNLAAQRMTAELQERAFEHVLKQDIAFFDSATTGSLTARIAASVPALQAILGDELADALRNVLWGVGGTLLLFYTSPLLSVVVLLSVPPIVVMSWLIGRRVKRHAAAMQQAQAECGTIAEEAISGIRTVRAFAQERPEAVRYRAHIARATAIARRKILASASASTVAFLTGEGAAVLAIWVGGRLIVGGRLTSGALISFILYAFLVARGFRNASEYWNEALRAFGSAEWIFSFLDRQPAMALEGGARLPRVLGEITFDHVHFSYSTRPEVEAIDGIAVRIAPGETVAFVGRSGAGKSTLLSLLLRFYDPNRGRILVDGTDIRHVDPSWLRAQIGAVLQDPVLFSRSIAENIRFGNPDASPDDVVAAADVACAREFIERLEDGFDTAAGDRGVRLSGGQRQRLAIARAVVKRPPILLLDEATSALDAENESLVHEALRALDYRPTTIIVAHRLSTVVHVHRVIVLDAGRIIAAGRHDELLRTSQFYRQLVDTQLVPA
jgi:ABC-type multidrug transport system fused ATPase/permease subunit